MSVDRGAGAFPYGEVTSVTRDTFPRGSRFQEYPESMRAQVSLTGEDSEVPAN